MCFKLYGEERVQEKRGKKSKRNKNAQQKSFYLYNVGKMQEGFFVIRYDLNHRSFSTFMCYNKDM